MSFTKTGLKELKANGTKLDKKVINVLLDQGTSEKIESYIKDVLNHGCESGIVGELIYYNDTIVFYEKYKKDIKDLLKDQLEQTGYNSPSELFGDKWEDEDLFIEDTNNQNLLAWFAFETVCYNIANELEMNI